MEKLLFEVHQEFKGKGPVKIIPGSMDPHPRPRGQLSQAAFGVPGEMVVQVIMSSPKTSKRRNSNHKDTFRIQKGQGAMQAREGDPEDGRPSHCSKHCYNRTFNLSTSP